MLSRLKPIAPSAVLAFVLSGTLWAQTTQPRPQALSIPSVSPPLPERFTLHHPHAVPYRLVPSTASSPPALQAHSEESTAVIWLGPRIVIRVKPETDLPTLLGRRPLTWLRTLEPSLHLLEAPDAAIALNQSLELAPLAGVLTCRPVIAQALLPHGQLSRRPNDPRFDQLWHLENRSENGLRIGPDLAAREAWTRSRGEGVVVAVVDDGVELSHPDLAPASSNALNASFTPNETGGLPTSSLDTHATTVAGFAVARGDNQLGITGLAPSASLASWKIFYDSFGTVGIAFDDRLRDMFQYQTEAVWVQNHSWGNASAPQLGPTDLEQAGIDFATEFGRDGRGVILVRSAGNGRQAQFNANDDGYANDPRVIAVGAVDSSGRTADYSSPGACLLVSAFGGGGDRALTSTDRTGTEGISKLIASDDRADYVTSTVLAGTSFSAPQVSGLVALILSINPALSIRDVQHILALSARQLDPNDPDVVLNQAGFQHSHNAGFGVPHAGVATALASQWVNRPTLTTHQRVSTIPRAIPDDGLRVQVTGVNIPAEIRSIPAAPSLGPHPDSPTTVLPLVDVGLATETIATDLRGKAALIRRSPADSPETDQHLFSGKIRRAAQAGAAFAVVYNDRDISDRFSMGGTDFSPIPAVMIDQIGGEALAAELSTNPSLRVQLQLLTASYAFGVVPSLACEHVGVRIRSTHPQRGDVRITVRSPHGTLSVLQFLSGDTSPGPTDTWTYWSTRHFGENTAGLWTVDISDEAPAQAGTVTRVELFLRGVAQTDTDADGLDDTWEQQWFDNLGQSPRNDPDDDGWSNAQEQLLHLDPTQSDRPFQAWVSLLNDDYRLLSWASKSGQTYDVLRSSQPQGPFEYWQSLTATEINGELLWPKEAATSRFLRIRQR